MEDAVYDLFTTLRHRGHAVQAGTPMTVQVEDTREEWHC